MFGDGPLTFREFAMREKLPLAVIHDAVLEFLRGRDDALVYGAQAVNAYVDEPRMTQDVDVMSTRAEQLADELRSHLNKSLHLAVRVRKVREGLGYRIYQVSEPKNRHLVDVRPVDALPDSQRVEGVLVLAPVDLIVAKVLSIVGRTKTAKSLIDRADVHRLHLQFPDLKKEAGPVAAGLRAAHASPEALAVWKQLVAEEIVAEDEDDGF
jgi:hypothetical protein